MSITCGRTALVEALFDERLGKSDRSSLERHLPTCAECTDRLRMLESLRVDVRGLEQEVTPLEHQRARLALLRKAAAPAHAPRRRVVLLAAALVFVPAAVFAAREVTTTVPPVQSAPEERVAPSLPPPAPVVVVTEPAVSVFVPAPRPTASAPPTRSLASRDFADAMDSVSRGDFGAGAAKLDRFAQSYPDDPRAEEAHYLEAIALERAGRVAEARGVAHRYLVSYPNGAHEAQAHRLAGE